MVYTLERRIENEELIISSKTNFLIQKMDVLKFQPEFDKYSVIANIPYYITSPILYHFLYETSHRPGEMIILLQQDVGDKIRKTRGNKSSVLSLFIDLACERVEEVCQVSAGNFVPAPKVESAILRFVLKKDFNKESAVSVLSVIKK
jgi:16S rRNA (adenine1518-N6/adenine1519-N6)-dimethyltransferase